ncbi:MAG: paraquat-inducible protein A [Planctomycetota bacterium]
MRADGGATLAACHCCGLVQTLPGLAAGERALCARCGTTILSSRGRRRSNRRAFASALAALILYPAAIGLPIMTLEQLGHRTEASVWTGSIGLLRRGELLVGTVVLVCSVVLPFVKLVALLAITGATRRLSRRRRALTYRLIEAAGRWGMLDVLLIALVVAWLKLGDLVDVQPGLGALAFTSCVLLSLVAGAWFDPHALWERGEEAP